MRQKEVRYGSDNEITADDEKKEITVVERNW